MWPKFENVVVGGRSDCRGGDMASPVLRRWSLVVMKTGFAVSRFVETQLGWVMVFDQILFRIWYSTVSLMAGADVW